VKFLSVLFLCLAPVHAQIYADIAVSQGGNDLGTVRIRLEHQKAPRTVANFIGLATGLRSWIEPATGRVKTNTPFYDGLIFHRLIHNFVIQGGDPTGTGSSGPGYIFQDEFDPTLRHTGRYLLSMANSGVYTNGSQFFITFRDAANLDDKHSIFGEVIDDAAFPGSRALVDSFTDSTAFPTGAGDRPVVDIVMDSITISGPDYAAFDIDDPGLLLPTFEPVENLRMEHVVSSDEFNLRWDVKVARDYPVFYSDDLVTFMRRGSTFSMVDESSSPVGITGLALGPKGFAKIPIAINYENSPTSPLPADFTAAGAVLELTWGDGTLEMVFDGAGSASWTFDDGSAVSSGSLASLNIETASPGIILEDGETYTTGDLTVASARSLRQFTAFLGSSVGTAAITAIQPMLSFHAPFSGYFDGAVNSTGSTIFRGTFIFTPAP